MASKKHSKLDRHVRSPSTCSQDLTDNRQRRSLRDSISSTHHLRLPRILDHVSSKFFRSTAVRVRLEGQLRSVSEAGLVQPNNVLASSPCLAWAQI